MTRRPTMYDFRRLTARLPRRTRRRRVVAAAVGTLDGVLDVNNLYRTYRRMAAKNGQAPGIDGVRYHDLSKTELFELFRRRVAEIRAGTYVPQPPRVKAIPKGDGTTRELQLAVIVDRVIEKAVADAIGPVAEKLFLDCSNGFRTGRDRFRTLAAVKVACETYGLSVLTEDDVRKAFDNVLISAAAEALRRLPIAPALADLAEVVLRGHDQQKEVGIAQGGALSPLTLNALLHDVIDTPMAAARGRHARVRYDRYADNQVVATRTPADGRRLLEEMRSRLAEVGLTLKGPGVPRLLAEGEHLELLGLRLSHAGGKLLLRIPHKKWAELEADLRAAYDEPNPTAAASQLVLGWVQAFAPSFGTTTTQHDIEVANRLVNLLRRTEHQHALTRREIARAIHTAAGSWEKLVDDARNKLINRDDSSSTTTDLTTNTTVVEEMGDGVEGRRRGGPDVTTASRETGVTNGEEMNTDTTPETAAFGPSSTHPLPGRHRCDDRRRRCCSCFSRSPSGPPRRPPARPAPAAQHCRSRRARRFGPSPGPVQENGFAASPRPPPG